MNPVKSVINKLSFILAYYVGAIERMWLSSISIKKTAPVLQHQSGIETRTPSDSEVTYYSIIVYIRRCTTDCKDIVSSSGQLRKRNNRSPLAVIFIPKKEMIVCQQQRNFLLARGAARYIPIQRKYRKKMGALKESAYTNLLHVPFKVLQEKGNVNRWQQPGRLTRKQIQEYP